MGFHIILMQTKNDVTIYEWILKAWRCTIKNTKSRKTKHLFRATVTGGVFIRGVFQNLCTL